MTVYVRQQDNYKDFCLIFALGLFFNQCQKDIPFSLPSSQAKYLHDKIHLQGKFPCDNPNMYNHWGISQSYCYITKQPPVSAMNQAFQWLAI